MIARFGPSWQTTTADLALILFLVVSAAAVDDDAAAVRPPHREVSPVETPSTAVYRPGSSMSLEDWLAGQNEDERLSITVLVQRAGGSRSNSLARGEALLTRIERTGRSAKMVVQPGPQDDISVVMAYDAPAGTALASLAR